jgi:hypothetical protein
MGSEIDKYKKNYPNMRVIVYCITGKEKCIPKTVQTGIRRKENR